MSILLASAWEWPSDVVGTLHPDDGCHGGHHRAAVEGVRVFGIEALYLTAELEGLAEIHL